MRWQCSCCCACAVDETSRTGDQLLSLYALKPRFQAFVRPFVVRLAAAGVTANAVTLLATAVSCALGALLLVAGIAELFLLLPIWMLLRMVLNAVDGMLASEHGQRSTLGAYLNELCDVISDAALYLPFVAVPPFGWGSVASVIFLAGLSEMAGVLGLTVCAERRYDGPMGKSDRAAVFGALGLAFGLAGKLPAWTFWVMPGVAVLIAITVVNRVRCGLAHAPTIDS